MSDQDNGMDVVFDITREKLNRLWNAEFECYTEEHEGASFHIIYNHDHYGLIGFSVHTCPPDCDIKIMYSRWERHPHHERDTHVYSRRKNWE